MLIKYQNKFKFKDFCTLIHTCILYVLWRYIIYDNVYSKCVTWTTKVGVVSRSSFLHHDTRLSLKESEIIVVYPPMLQIRIMF